MSKVYLPILITLFGNNSDLYYKFKKYITRKEKFHNKVYKSIGSDQQFYTVLTIKDGSYIKLAYRLKLLLAKHTRIDLDKLLSDIVSKKMKDSEIYALIASKKWGGKLNIKKNGSIDLLPEKIPVDLLKKIETQPRYRDYIHAMYIATKIKKSIGELAKHLPILDYSCGDCNIINILAKGLPKNKVHACDIPQWFKYKKRANDNITFTEVQIGKKLPYKNGEFGLVTCKMVLHHIENLNFSLGELSRIIKKGGYLYIEEHDAVTDYDYMLCDIEHALFEAKKFKKFQKEYYAKYYDHIELEYIMQSYGFQMVDFGYKLLYFKDEIGPTRTYWAIYSKNPIKPLKSPIVIKDPPIIGK
jgi:ubiquinone/menaquinone biosynthesis C-methylase UbiE